MREIVYLYMLLELKNTIPYNIEKLTAFAKVSGIELSFIDEGSDDYHLPGKPLTDEQLMAYIDKSKTSGTVDMDTAHQLIRKMFNGD